MIPPARLSPKQKSRIPLQPRPVISRPIPEPSDVSYQSSNGTRTGALARVWGLVRTPLGKLQPIPLRSVVPAQSPPEHSFESGRRGHFVAGHGDADPSEHSVDRRETDLLLKRQADDWLRSVWARRMRRSAGARKRGPVPHRGRVPVLPPYRTGGRPRNDF